MEGSNSGSVIVISDDEDCVVEIEKKDGEIEKKDRPLNFLQPLLVRFFPQQGFPKKSSSLKLKQ